MRDKSQPLKEGMEDKRRMYESVRYTEESWPSTPHLWEYTIIFSHSFLRGFVSFMWLMRFLGRLSHFYSPVVCTSLPNLLRESPVWFRNSHIPAFIMFLISCSLLYFYRNLWRVKGRMSLESIIITLNWYFQML